MEVYIQHTEIKRKYYSSDNYIEVKMNVVGTLFLSLLSFFYENLKLYFSFSCKLLKFTMKNLIIMISLQAPLSSANFLYDLDQVTKKIVDNLIQMKRLGVSGMVKVPEFNNLEVNVTNASIPQLMNLRRQYITYSKMHPPNPAEIPLLFVQYLSTSLN